MKSWILTLSIRPAKAVSRPQQPNSTGQSRPVEFGIAVDRRPDCDVEPSRYPQQGEIMPSLEGTQTLSTLPINRTQRTQRHESQDPGFSRPVYSMAHSGMLPAALTPNAVDSEAYWPPAAGALTASDEAGPALKEYRAGFIRRSYGP